MFLVHIASFVINVSIVIKGDRNTVTELLNDISIRSKLAVDMSFPLPIPSVYSILCILSHRH